MLFFTVEISVRNVLSNKLWVGLIDWFNPFFMGDTNRNKSRYPANIYLFEVNNRKT